MKKIFTLIAVGMMALTASAQLVVGGAINFSANGGMTTKDNEQGLVSKAPVNFQMGIAPQVGYIINEKFEIGAALDFGYSQIMNYSVKTNKEGKKGKALKDYSDNDFVFTFNPYARYRCFETHGFGIWIEGVVALGTFTDNTKYYAMEYDGTTYRSKDDAAEMNKPGDWRTSHFTGGLFFQPVLTYDINEHFVLETTLNFLGFNLSGTSSKTKYVGDNSLFEGDWNQMNTCTFGLNITTENVATINGLTIGCKYKF